MASAGLTLHVVVDVDLEKTVGVVPEMTLVVAA
jgi:hypothetical protein